MARRPDLGPRPGYHEGEIAVQQRAGVRTEARHLIRMLDPVQLVGGIVGILAQQTLIVLTARDQCGTLWSTPLAGPAGFLQVAGPKHLHIAAAPSQGDPLFGLSAGQEVGQVTMELAKRRRFRINGHLDVSGPTGLSVKVEQSYGNCPQYIQQRTLTPAHTPRHRNAAETAATDPEDHRVRDRLSDEDIAQIRTADTFFLGTTHPTRGTDASHRGGPSGFVRVEDDHTLWWPDYQGNNMFNSLGNLEVDPTAALVFIDFATGRTLHLSGRAVLHTTASGAVGDDGRTGRRVRFHLESTTIGSRLPQRTAQVVAYRRNPPVTA